MGFFPKADLCEGQLHFRDIDRKQGGDQIN